MGNSNSSSVGSSISDLFYPDNPNRRARARQLQMDCANIVTFFNQEKGQLESLEKDVETNMNTYLKSHGYETLDDLITHVNSVLTGPAMQQWKDLQQQLSQQHAIGNAILSISGIIAAGTGVVCGVLVVLTVISGPVGWAIFGAVGAAAAALAIVMLPVEAILGSEEKEKLDKAIDQLVAQRAQAQQQLMQLQVYNNWTADFNQWFTNDWYTLDPNIFEHQFGAQFQTDMSKTSKQYVLEFLAQLDGRRNSWTKEDPSPDRISVADVPANSTVVSKAVSAIVAASNKLLVESGEEVVAHIHLMHSSFPSPRSMSLRLLEASSNTDCEAIDTKTSEKWAIHADVPKIKQSVHFLSQVRFHLKNLTTGQEIDKCKISFQTVPGS